LKQFLVPSRFSSRPFSFIVFGMLAMGIAAAPFRASAQQSTEPPAQPAITSPAAEAANPPKTEAAKTEENENDQYRHAPIVQSLAHLLHLEVETAARLFEIINVGVVVLAILIPLVRLMPRLLRKRSEKVRNDIESARKVTEDANSRLSAVEAKLSSLDQEIAKFRNEVEQEILQDEARIKAALEEESTRIVASAEQQIGMAAAQAKRSLRHFAADLAIEQATRQLVLTPEADRALIAEFVRDTTGNGAGQRGQN
jgi:F-type H+-transporting ATPase subunit b